MEGYFVTPNICTTRLYDWYRLRLLSGQASRVLSIVLLAGGLVSRMFSSCDCELRPKTLIYSLTYGEDEPPCQVSSSNSKVISFKTYRPDWHS